jgi:hypothetical protein
MLGDLVSGYIVTPRDRTYAALVGVFDRRLNQQGPACGPSQTGALLGKTALSPINRVLNADTARTDGLPVEPPDGWSNPFELTATHTFNVWRTSRGAVINSWMDIERMTGWRLWVRFTDEDGQPAVWACHSESAIAICAAFVPARRTARLNPVTALRHE